MENTLKLLTSFSNVLDEKKLESYANRIDKVSFSLGKIVTAQFEGGIGYWIRNSRCWDNCYRQNRTKSPDKPTQLVWQSCWEEYKKSIGNDDSGWEKYAEKDGMIKTASKEIINKQKETFGNEVSKLVKEGMTIDTAISAIEYQRQNNLFDKMIRQAEVLTKIATDLKEKDDNLSKELLGITQELIKEAGIWSGLMGKGKTYQKTLAIFKQNIGQMMRNLQKAAQNPALALRAKGAIVKEINIAMGNLNSQLQNAGFANRKITDLNNDFITKATPIFNQIILAKTQEQIAPAIQGALSFLTNFAMSLDSKLEMQQKQDVAQLSKKAPGGYGPATPQEQTELPQILSEATPLQIAEDSINKGRFDDVIKMILSNPSSADALKQWIASSGERRVAAYNVMKNKKFAQINEAEISDALKSPTGQSSQTISTEDVERIMNAIKQKMGPGFTDWLNKNYSNVEGTTAQSAASPATPVAPAAQKSEIDVQQIQQFLSKITDEASKIVNDLPENDQQKVNKYIKALNSVPAVIDVLQDSIRRAKAGPGSQMMGYHGKAPGGEQFTTGLNLR